VPIQAGTYKLGPENATLAVNTGRTGAAAKAGHDLVIDVTSWAGMLDVGKDPGQISITLNADAASLRVLEGTGGMQALGDDDKSSIEQPIDDEVLEGKAIEFRSTEVETIADGSRLRVQGELTLVGKSNPDRLRVDRRRGRTLERQRHRQADRLGDQALFDAVRSAQGRRRGRGRHRSQPAVELIPCNKVLLGHSPRGTTHSSLVTECYMAHLGAAVAGDRPSSQSE
jgi:hypothetical protein